MWQSKTLIPSTNVDQKIVRTRVFDYLNTVSSDNWSAYVDCQDVFDCRLPGVFFGIRSSIYKATGVHQRQQVDENYCLYLHINFDFLKHELWPLNVNIYICMLLLYVGICSKDVQTKHDNINGLPSNVCLPDMKECVHLRGHRSETIIVSKFVQTTILLTINSMFTHLMQASVFVEHRQTMQIQIRRRRMRRLYRVYTVSLQYVLTKFELKGNRPLAGYGLHPSKGDFVDYIFLEAQCLGRILQKVSPLTRAALSCNSLLYEGQSKITEPYLITFCLEL